MNRLYLIVGCFALAVIALAEATSGFVDWPFAGQNLADTRGQSTNVTISPANVGQLQQRWAFTTGGDVSATPTVAGNMVYVPDWAGNLFAVERDTGQLVWSHRISEYDGVSTSISRVSPAIYGNEVIIGDQQDTRSAHSGASIIAVDSQTGTLRWITKVESHPAAVITGSPVVFGNVVYVGVSSIEESLATDPNYPCCSFQGSVVALDVNNGDILWKTPVMPNNEGRPGGYSGGAIWQIPAIDPNRGMLYIGTGNNYTAPASVEACGNANPMANCASPDDHFDSALALDLKTGTLKWARRLQGFDVWTVACLSKPPGVNCPDPASPDYDLGGAGPNLVDNLVGFGQKSGIYWALNADTGDIVWSSMVGPGGTLGGIEWGTATDGQQIYVAIGNNAHTSYQLANGGPTITWGSWAALNAQTGKVVWQIADPTPGTIDTGSVSVANGVLYAGSYSGSMYGLSTVDGKILFQFASGGSVIDGPSISGSFVYWGSGYGHIAPGISNNKLYAFSLPTGGR